MSDSHTMNDIDFPCVGVCMADEAGYCLGCGRPPAPLVALSGEARDEPARRTDDQREAVASALSTTLTQ